ncbi:MAG: hypothetical protein COV10_00600 [Candidatus Vogelbacteria bacterium CG10_big_fil_rev_8_21_14_0_10_51_16]|uniref:Transposase IS200-like domain-containing protein n=1 Tax=Candidatus Vogelbacteria bacterium CG10_big_fil_rev_8_21_14_0_10_51_16 TaxID=1975045 RepID=A0A2H0RF42_9BACT|nr:MAG: hypothetical protein COV10_00600 [Candidatus Vogelbacteria bacterium CG10_big_fil_rev_8_21_14_0_10_51_16]
MNRVPIELDTFHHVYNRGTEKRLIFMNDADRARFMLYVDILNNTKLENPSKLEQFGLLEEYSVKERLVDVVALCLMDNHFHLLLYERTEGGISKFMQRLGTAYTVYFNEKYERTGALFQGRFKSKLVTDEAYLFYLINYVHFNVRDLLPPDRRFLSDIIKFLEIYPWSSYAAYAKLRPQPRWLQTENVKKYVSFEKDYKSELLALYDEADTMSDTIGGLAIDE